MTHDDYMALAKKCGTVAAFAADEGSRRCLYEACRALQHAALAAQQDGVREAAGFRSALEWMRDRDNRNGSLPEAYREKIDDALGHCGCNTCIKARGELGMRMITCSTCGNKRCPKATDHTLACTGSNEPGQPGSIYGVPLRRLEQGVKR